MEYSVLDSDGDDDRKVSGLDECNNNDNSDNDDRGGGCSNTTEVERRRRRLALDSVSRDASRVWTTLPLPYRQSKEFVLAALKSLHLPSKSDFERTFPQALRFDRDVVLGFCARPDFSKLYYSRHLYVPDCLVGDKQVMLAYCSKIPRSLQECKEELCNDREVVEAAIALDGLELQYASPRLRGDRHLVTKACQNNGKALEFCPMGNVRTQLTSDRDFMLKVLSKHGGAMLRLVPPNLKHDKQLLLEALAHGMRFRYVPQDYQTSKEFLGEALKRNSSLYLEMNKTLQLDRDLALATVVAQDSTVEIHKRALNNCPSLKQNKYVVMAIAKRGDRDMLEQILTTSVNNNENNNNNNNDNNTNQFTQDKELMMAAIQRDCKLFKYTHRDLRQDEELILASIQEHSVQDTLREISIETRRLYPSITIKAIRVSSQWRLRHIKQMIPDTHWRNKKVIVAWVERGGPILDVFERLVVYDEDLALLVAKHNWIEFKKISPALLANPDFMFRAVQQDGRVIRFASHDIQNNFDILVHAIANHHRAFIGIHKTNTTTPTPTTGAAAATRPRRHNGNNNNANENNNNNNDNNTNPRSNSSSSSSSGSTNQSQQSNNSSGGQQQQQPYYRDYYDYIQKSFKPRVKELLDLQLTFVNDFLRGIATSSKTNHKLPPAKRSQLPMLDRGIETSQAFKQLIAEYLGVPIGQDLKVMRLAWYNLNYPPSSSSSSAAAAASATTPSPTSGSAAAAAMGPRNTNHNEPQETQQHADNNNNNNMLNMDRDVVADEEDDEIIMEDDEFMHIMGHHRHRHHHHIRGRYMQHHFHHHLAPAQPPPPAAQRPAAGAEDDDDNEDHEQPPPRNMMRPPLHNNNHNDLRFPAAAAAAAAADFREEEEEEILMEMEMDRFHHHHHPAAIRAERRRAYLLYRDRDRDRDRDYHFMMLGPNREREREREQQQEGGGGGRHRERMMELREMEQRDMDVERDMVLERELIERERQRNREQALELALEREEREQREERALQVERLYMEAAAAARVVLEEEEDE